MTPQPLAGRKIIVTGAASGMGRAIAQRFAAEGAVTALFDLNAAGMDELAGGGATLLPTDMASPDAVKASVARAAEAMGGIDGLVNAAGVLRIAPFAETDLTLWREVMDVNLQGPYLLCHAALPHLKAARAATIVNIASTAGLTAPTDMAAYAASKGGLIALTKVLAAELGPTVRVNAIAPGIIRTAMTKFIWQDGGLAGNARSTTGAHLALQRIGEPDEIAEVALFLSSAQSSFMTGTVTVVDGGSTWY